MEMATMSAGVTGYIAWSSTELWSPQDNPIVNIGEVLKLMLLLPQQSMFPQGALWRQNSMQYDCIVV